MSKQKRKQSNVSTKVDVKKKKRRKSVPGYVQKTSDRVKTLLTCPDSALTEANIKTFVNEETLQKLPPYLQYKLITLLPRCDQNICNDGSLAFSDEAFTNEFFTKACEEWRGKLAEGCFTDDRLQHMNIERSRQQANDTWKIKYFESTVPQEHTLGDCSQSTLAVLTTPQLLPSRKRKLDAEQEEGEGEEEEELADKNAQKKLKTTRAKDDSKLSVAAAVAVQSKSTDEISQSPDNYQSSTTTAIEKEHNSSGKKRAVAGKDGKSTAVKKTRSSKNNKSNKMVVDSGEAKERNEGRASIESSAAKEVPAERPKCPTVDQSIKSKILSHLNNKLARIENQQKAEPVAAENSVELQADGDRHVPQGPGEGTLTLSDLISREFELVCNGPTRGNAASAVKFENFKVGFLGPKMFHLGRCPNSTSPSSSSSSSSSSSALVLPNIWKLIAPDGDGRTALPPEVGPTKSCPASSSSNSTSSMESKRACSTVSISSGDRPLAEYFPLLSESLRNPLMVVEPSISHMKTLSSKRKVQNAVEKETLLCLANKLNRKLLGKTALAPPPLSEGNSSPATTASKVAEWPPPSFPIETTVLAPGAVSKPQNVGTNFDLLKNILLSMGAKSSTQSSCRSFCATPTPSSAPSPVKVPSAVGPSKTSPEKSTKKMGVLAFNVTSALGNATLVGASTYVAPCSESPPSFGNTSQDSCVSPMQRSSPSSRLPLPVVQTNLMEQREKFLATQGKILELPLSINQIAVQSAAPLPFKVFSQKIHQEAATAGKSPIRANLSLHRVGLSAGPKPQPVATFAQTDPRAPSSFSAGQASALRPPSSDVDVSANGILLHSLILNEKCRIPQNVLKTNDALVQLNLPQPSSRIPGSNCSSNNNNNVILDDDNLAGRTSFQVPLVSTLRLQSPLLHQGSQVLPFRAPSVSSIGISNGSSPFVIISPVNQQLNLASYLAINKTLTENPLSNRAVSVKKNEIAPSNLYQLNLMPSQTYLPMVNVPQMSPTASKSQIILLQNSSLVTPANSKALALPPDSSDSSSGSGNNNNSLKNVTFIPIVNTSTNNNQMFLLLSPNVVNSQK